MKREMGDRSPSPATLESRKRQNVLGQDMQADGKEWGNGADATGGHDAAGGNGALSSNDGAAARRPQASRPSVGPDGRLEPACAIKMLVPSLWAGCLIGKGGITINELQERTGARIKLSQNQDFYPGTQDRIVLITGEPDTVRHALALVTEHLHTHGPRNQGGATPAETPTSSQVKLLIAKAAGGLLIGRAGATIKTLNEECGARIQLAAKDDAGGVVTGERIVTLAGPLDGVLKGMSRILDKLCEEPDLARYQNLTTSYSRSTSAAHPLHPAFDVPTYQTQSFAETAPIFSPPQQQQQHPPQPPPPPQHPHQGPPPGHGVQQNMEGMAQIKIQVPDRLIGSVLGKGGQVLRDLQQSTGARITISKRGEYAPGTTNRIVTIDGPTYAAAESARRSINLKVQQGQQFGPGMY